MMEDMLSWGRRILASQPYSVLLGAELLGFSEDRAELNVPIKAQGTIARLGQSTEE